MKKTVLIMAGGKGERFWPRSRTKLPKQFISLTEDGKTMIQLTVERILPIVDIEDIFIATNESYRHLVQEQLPDLPERNIITEPVGRNTAPCIGLGAVHIRKKYGDAVMFVLPSDHLIADTAAFHQILLEAAEVAEQGNNLITIGIKPEYPETGYGYIQFRKNSNGKCSDGETAKCPEKESMKCLEDKNTQQTAEGKTQCSAGGNLSNALMVERFVEKPDLETAKKYLEAGTFLWNSGMFTWKISSILDNLQKYMPDSYDHLLKIEQSIGNADEEAVLKAEFPLMESQSIDYGVMERAENIYTFPGDFGWDDVGSWLAIERINHTDEDGNTLAGHVVTVDSHGCIIQGQKKLIAAVGLEDLIIVDTDDATLICRKEKAGDIKKVLEKLRSAQDTECL